jgi:hypothetical protein
MGLDDRNQAIAWLRKAYEQHSAEMIFLRTPSWDSLRSEPKFIEGRWPADRLSVRTRG